MNKRVKPTARRRRLSPDERRQQIIDGAVAYFAEVGLGGNTRDLATRLGVTQSLIFKYFDSKAELLEAVYDEVYLNRVSSTWAPRLTDRSRPLRERLTDFYKEYAAAIFTEEWMRIFVSAGLAGSDLNRRYLDHIRELFLQPLLEEMRVHISPERPVDAEDIWLLHGSIVYLGIRKFVYRVPVPDDLEPVISRAVEGFIRSHDLDHHDP